MAESVLVVAPHPDDEAIGCGGAVCLHRQRGDPVDVVFLTSGERGIEGMAAETVRSIREAEAESAGEVLRVSHIDFLRQPDMGLFESIEPAARQLVKVLTVQPPDLIYLPHPEESHPDHAAALPIVHAALKHWECGRKLPELRGYEVWSPMKQYGWVEDVSAVFARKLRAVRCYRSQLAGMRYDRAIRGLGQYRGIMSAGSRYAEAFLHLDPRTPEPI